jgi:hypothetical protein
MLLFDGWMSIKSVSRNIKTIKINHDHHVQRSLLGLQLLSREHNIYIMVYVTKPLKKPGFIKLTVSELKLSTFLKALYWSLVRLVLDYGSIMWHPNSYALF